MNNATLKNILAELESVLCGQRFGKIFLLAKFDLAIDFRLNEGKYLFTSISPAAPRIYLISRRLKDLEKQSVNASPFVLFLRKRLSGAVLRGIEKLDNERVLKFAFSGQTELGETVNHALIIQLTGRSANIFLLDARDFILDAMRENSGEGQEIGTVYAPPFRGEEKRRRGEEETFPKKDFATVSEALDDFYQTREAEIRFQSKAQAARNELKQKIAKREKLVKNLSQDLANHGDAEQWKRFGDLLLANLANAKRTKIFRRSRLKSKKIRRLPKPPKNFSAAIRRRETRGKKSLKGSMFLMRNLLTWRKNASGSNKPSAKGILIFSMKFPAKQLIKRAAKGVKKIRKILRAREIIYRLTVLRFWSERARKTMIF
jgi:predicted ribosome quality control (RQC) complex YloA/Tae2 family protein